MVAVCTLDSTPSGAKAQLYTSIREQLHDVEQHAGVLQHPGGAGFQRVEKTENGAYG